MPYASLTRRINNSDRDAPGDGVGIKVVYRYDTANSATTGAGNKNRSSPLAKRMEQGSTIIGRDTTTLRWEGSSVRIHWTLPRGRSTCDVSP